MQHLSFAPQGPREQTTMNSHHAHNPPSPADVRCYSPVHHSYYRFVGWGLPLHAPTPEGTDASSRSVAKSDVADVGSEGEFIRSAGDALRYEPVHYSYYKFPGWGLRLPTPAPEDIDASSRSVVKSDVADVGSEGEFIGSAGDALRYEPVHYSYYRFPGWGLRPPTPVLEDIDASSGSVAGSDVADVGSEGGFIGGAADFANAGSERNSIEPAAPAKPTDTTEIQMCPIALSMIGEGQIYHDPQLSRERFPFNALDNPQQTPTPYDLRYGQFIDVNGLEAYTQPPETVSPDEHIDWTSGRSTLLSVDPSEPRTRWFRNDHNQPILRYDTPSRTRLRTLASWQTLPGSASFDFDRVKLRKEPLMYGPASQDLPCSDTEARHTHSKPPVQPSYLRR